MDYKSSRWQPLLLCGGSETRDGVGNREMDISYLDFKSSGGVTAESIGAAPPVCAPKSMAVIDNQGQWECTQAPEAGSGLGMGSSTLLLVAAAAVGAWWWMEKGKTKHKAPIGAIEGAGGASL